QCHRTARAPPGFRLPAAGSPIPPPRGLGKRRCAMDHSRGSPGPGHPAVPLWDRDWLDAYPRDVPSSLPYPAVPVSTLLGPAARRSPGRAGCAIYGKAISYAGLAGRARRLAAALADLGAGPGRRVGMLLPNIPEYILALQAAWLTGATVLQLSPLMVAEEI